MTIPMPNPNTLATLARFILPEDAGLTREQFLRAVLDRLSTHLAAVPVTKVSNARERILAYLTAASIDKTTGEVARACYVTTGVARRNLWMLTRAGLVEATDAGASGHTGNPIFWNLKRETTS